MATSRRFEGQIPDQPKAVPFDGSGKTQFNRGKAKGASWTAARAKAIENNAFRLPGGKR
jgi:hypothetical protein